jgi:hypothetical protein
MTTEQLANNAITTLNGGITSIATSLIVTSATLFPTVPQFRILVDTEVMLVTAVSGTTFTVSRGIENTTQVAHNSGATVTAILTAGALQKFRSDNIILDLFSNRPATGFTGQTFIPSDGGYQQIWDSSQWRPLVNNILCTESPSAATFSTLVNWSSTTLTKTNGILYINAPAPGASGTARAALTSIPSPSSCQIQCLSTLPNATQLATATQHTFPGCGVVMYESNSGKFATITMSQSTSYQGTALPWMLVSASIWTNSTTRTTFSDLVQWTVVPFIRLRVASATLFWEISSDLQTWQTITSVAANTVITSTGLPSHYGVATAHFTNGTVPPVFGQFNHLVLA